MVQRLLLLTRPGLVATHWSGLSMESLLDLGMSLPSTVGHNDHEMPPKHGQICGYEGALLTGSWPLPAASTKIKSWPLKDADLQRPLQRSSGWRQKIRHSVLWEKPGKTGLQIVRCFQVKIFYESKFLHLLIPRETLMSQANIWTWFSWLAPQQLSCFY